MDNKYTEALAEYKESKKYIKQHFGPKPSHCKGKKVITEEDVKYIRENYCAVGLTQLAKQMELTKSCVYNCAKGMTWKHLNHKYRPVF